MSGYGEELLNPKATPATPKKGYAEELLNPEMTARDPNAPMGGLNENADAPEFGFWNQMRASLAPDTKTKIKRYSQSSGIPEDRFGAVKGEIVYWNGKELVPVVPSMSGGDGVADKFSRLGENVAASTGGALPSVAGMAAGAVMGPTGASIPAAGAVAGATNIGVQALDKAMAGEDVTGGYRAIPAIGDAALNMTGQAGGNLLVKLFTKNPMGLAAFDRLKAMDPKVIKDASDLQKVAKQEFGIDLTTGQASDLNSMLVWERQAGRWPETTDMVKGFRDAQWGEQVPSAVRGEINKLSPVTGEDAVSKFRSGANDVVKGAEEARATEARLAFGKALDDTELHPAYNTPQLDEMMRRPIMAKAWERAKERAANQNRILPEYFKTDAKGRITNTVQKPDWRAWHDIKKGLDDIIDSNLNTNGKPTGPGYDAMAVKREMMGLLKKANPDYAEALIKYGESSDAVDMILSGGVGILKNTKGMDTTKVVNKIFNEGAVTPQEVTRMRQMFYSAGKGEEWNAGVAAWLEGSLGKALGEFNQGTGNVPGRFYKTIYGTPEQRNITAAAIGFNNMEPWEKLLNILKAARKSLPEGSPTVTDLGSRAPDKITSVSRVAGKALSGETFLNPGNTIATAVDNLRQPEARIRLAKALLSKDGVEQLRKLRMLPPSGEKAMKAVADLMIKVGIVGGVDAALPGETFAPEGRPKDPSPSQ